MVLDRLEPLDLDTAVEVIVHGLARQNLVEIKVTRGINVDQLERATNDRLRQVKASGRAMRGELSRVEKVKVETKGWERDGITYCVTPV
ncbi:MAG: hypothetical protein M1358_09885 [Chloroflexi bacterium]|nr:hypothetical protein [Chloroflexota bacterium]